MRPWVKKLVNQFDIEWDTSGKSKNSIENMSDETATLLFIIDTYSKNLFEIDKQPIRKVREALDEYSKSLLTPGKTDFEKLFFRIRQFFGGYRIEEYSYIQKTFEDFKNIIWDFADQLSEDARYEQIHDEEVKKNLGDLREAVESNSIDDLRIKSREFIDQYIEYQYKREKQRQETLVKVEKNLSTVRKKLVEVNQNMRVDHLTQAYNRMSFDEQIKKHHRLFELSKTPASLLSLDIDFFKKINDSYGHDIGDYVLQECVKTLKEVCYKDGEFIARVGGEEFAIILPDCTVEQAARKADDILNKVRKEVYIHGNLEIKFTVSIGVAELAKGESLAKWVKRADEALYHSKQYGRNRYSIIPYKSINAA
jgi:diguanylate cyclase